MPGSMLKKVAIVLWAISIVVEIISMATIYITGAVPLMYVALIFGIMLLLSVLTGALIFVQRDPKKMKLQRGISSVLSLLFAVLFLVITYLVLRFANTLKNITAQKNSTSAYAVYVLENDPAEELADTAGYRFALSDSYEPENLAKVLQDINKTAGTSIATDNRASVVEAAESLLAGENQALIMSEAYTSVLENLEGYEDFDARTRIVYEVAIENEEKQEEKTETAQTTTEKKEPFVMYLSGSDTRDDTLTVSRSDTNILLACNPETKQILLVNTPRDYYVQNPALGNGYDKLTHCGLYGIENSMQALEKLYGVNVDYYAQINFTGFEKLIDDIGGVEITVTDNIYTNEGKLMMEPGTHRLNGAHALLFARLRKTLAGGDNDRGKNQMQVIKAMIEQISATDILTNYGNILNDIEGMFQTNLSYEQIAELIRVTTDRSNGTWNINSVSVTGTGGKDVTASTGSALAYVTYQDEESIARAAKLLQQLLNDETISKEDTDSDSDIHSVMNFSSETTPTPTPTPTPTATPTPEEPPTEPAE